LVRGYLPYRDFVHVQPPGVLLVLAPFALAKSWGFTAAKLFYVIVAAANIGLIWHITRRWFGSAGALIAALVYALSRASIGATTSLLIEPLVSGAVLAAVVVYRPHASRSSSTRRCAVVGLLLAVALALKFMAAIVIASFLIALLVDRHRRSDVRPIVLGIGLGSVCLLGPFVAFAPRSFVRDAIRFQAERSSAGLNVVFGSGIRQRLLSSYWFAGVPPDRQRTLAAIVVFFAVLLLAAWGMSKSFVGRFCSAWLLIGTIGILAAPDFYEHYGEIVAPPLAILAGGAMSAAVRWTWPPRRRPVYSAAVGLVGLLIAAGGVNTALEHLPANQFIAPGTFAQNTRIAARVIPDRECAIADSPAIVLALPDLFAYASNADGPTVDSLAASVIARHDGSPAPGFAEFKRRMTRCPWFAATPANLAGYPGWTHEMAAWFRTNYDRLEISRGIQIWHRDTASSNQARSAVRSARSRSLRRTSGTRVRWSPGARPGS
jgi:hypothetical protein